MKGTAITLLCAITLAQGRELFLGNRQLCTCNPSDAHAICANWDLEDIVIAHERCDKFYKCAYDKPVPYCCPRGTVFNIEKEECDWPTNVECGDRGFVPDEENECLQSNDNEGGGGDQDEGDLGPCNCDPSEAPSICEAPGSEDVLVAHEYCNHFYICNHGKPVAMKCGPQTLYNPYKRECAWAHEIECGDRIIPEDNGSGDGNENDGDDSGGDNQGPCNCDPAEAPEICAAEGSDGILVAHEYCHKYYTCIHGKPFPMTCPPNTLYNPYIKRCDWPRNVDCGDRICICDDGEDNECDGGGAGGGGDGAGGGDGGGGGGDSGEGDGGGDGGGGGGSGEGGDGESGGGGGGGGGDGSCNCDASEAPTICAQDESDGVLVAHENCNQFYKCNHGKPVAMYCPADTLYNPYIEKCDWPHNVDCGDRVIPEDKDEEGGGSSGGNGGGEGDGGGDGGDGGGSGEGGDGGDGGSSGGGGGGGDGVCNCDASEAPTICAQDESDGVLVAHENCNQFYKCNHGIPVAMYCPADTLYNPYIEKCDWPHNVDCGDRVIPEDKDEEGGGSSGGNGGGEGDGGGDGGDGGGSGEGGDGGDGGSSGGGGGGGDGVCNCDASEAPTICAQDESDGVLVAHENCNQFYKCNHGKPVAMYCPAGTLYNPYIEKCDWPHNVDCGDRVIPEDKDEEGGGSSGGNGGGEGDGGGDGGDGGGSGEGGDGGDGGSSGGGGGGGDGVCNCDASEAPTICAQDESDGVLVAHENCNQFYKCNHEKPVAMYCPAGTLYNPYIEKCDWPHNVDCGDRVIPEDKDEEGGGSSGGNGGGEGDGGGDGGDGGGSGEGGDGGDGGSSGGGGGGGDGVCNCDASEAPTICAQDESDGVLVAHENCNQFYKCAHGKPVAMNCPKDLLYNPYKEECDWADDVECGDRVIPDNEGGCAGGGDCQDNSSVAPEICTTPGSNGVLVAHQRCDRFYMCSRGQAIVVSCPSDMPLFNPVIGACDEAENVDCGDRIVPDPDEDPCPCLFNMPAVCSSPGTNGMQIPHEQCNQFYTCIRGSAVSHACPQGLFYEPRKQVCEWPMFVSCDGRIIPPMSR